MARSGALPSHTEATSRAEDMASFRVGDIIHIYLFPVIIGFGLVGNSLSVAVLARRQQRKFISTYSYLLLLAVSDSCMLLLGLFLRSKSEISEEECQFVVFLFHTLSLSCIYLIVFMTLDKCIAIWWPLKAQIYCTSSRVRITCAVFAVLNIAFNIPHAFNYEIVDGFCIAFPLQKTHDFFAFYIWVHFCLSCILPFILIITCNCCIIRKLRSRDRKSLSGRTKMRTDKITGMLLGISITMLLLTLPQYIRYVYYSLVDYDQDPVRHGRYIMWYNITNKLFFTNHSVNFILCCICGSKFRGELRKLFRCQETQTKQNSISSMKLITMDPTAETQDSNTRQQTFM